jgi:hypothetical protein
MNFANFSRASLSPFPTSLYLSEDLLDLLEDLLDLLEDDLLLRWDLGIVVILQGFFLSLFLRP